MLLVLLVLVTFEYLRHCFNFMLHVCVVSYDLINLLFIICFDACLIQS